MRSRIVASLLAASLWCAALAGARAAAFQETSMVDGTVILVDDDGHGHVTKREANDVAVYAKGGSGYETTRTGPSGYFRFDSLESGHLWHIKAKVRYYEQQGDYTVYVSNTTERCTIKPDPPIYVMRQTAGGSGGGTHIVLALYRVDDRGGARDRNPVTAARGDAAQGLTLTGYVRDADKQPVTAARIAIEANKTNTKKLFTVAKTTTDKGGGFTLALPDSPRYDSYILSVTKEGFEEFFEPFTPDSPPPEQITLSEQSSEAEAPLLEKNEATRRYVFTSRLMEALPVPGLRSFDSFALLAPGVAPAPDTPNTRGPGVSPGVGTAGQFAVNGLRSRENNFTVDGSDNNDEDIGTRRQGFVALAPQPVESLQEFQIVTALGGARFGRNMGGQVNALTKSGAPDIHGSLYGFVSDSRLNARGPFDAAGGPASFPLRRAADGAPVLLDGRPVVTPNPSGGENPFTRTQLGAVAGGPLEAIGSFFFASFERVRTRALRESHFVVPTVEQRGLFNSGATGLLLPSRNIFDPDTPQPMFPSSVPGDAIFSLYPFPNNPLGPFGANTYTSALNADGEGTRLSGKLDRQFGTPDPDKRRHPWSFLRDGDILIGRYSLSQETSTIPVTGDALFSSLRPRVRAQNVAFYLNRTLTRRISDVIRFSFGRTKLSFREQRDPYLSPSGLFPGTPFLLNAPLLLNVTAPLPDGTLTPPSYVSAASAQGAALLAARGYTNVTRAEQIAGALGQVVLPGFSPVGVDVYNFPQSRANNTIQAADTITYVARGGHIYTFGNDTRKTQINSTLDRGFRPLALFGGLSTFDSPLIVGSLPGGGPLPRHTFSPATLAAGGLPTGLFQTLADEPNSTIGIRFTQVSFFFQGNWRLGDNVRLTGGVRYDYNTVPDTKGKVIEKAFDRDEFAGQVQRARLACEAGFVLPPPECRDQANQLLSSFPADFKVSFGKDRNDVDGRLGLAWALNGRTVLRGGFGTYSGQFPGIVLGQSRNAFPDFLSLNFADTPYFVGENGRARTYFYNPTTPLLRLLDSSLAIAPNSLNTIAPNANVVSFLIQPPRFSGVLPRRHRVNLTLPQKELKTPYSLEYGVTFERQLGRDYAASVSYVGTRALKLLRVNTPDLGFANSNFDNIAAPNLTSYNSDNFPDLDAFIRPPQNIVFLTTIARTLYESSASSTYHSLQFELRRRYARRLQFSSALTYSHAIDDASDFFDTAGSFALPQDSLRRSERASSNFDIRLRSVTHAVYDIPRDFFFLPKHSKLGGWQLAAIVTAQTGQPYTVNSAFDINRDGNLTDRLNTTAGLITDGADGGRVQLRLAPGVDTFSLLADGRDGAVGRNTFRAPGLFDVDLSVTKLLSFGDRYRLNLRAEVFNLLNRQNFGIPVRILESPAFGRATYTTTPPRTVQLAAKFFF